MTPQILAALLAAGGADCRRADCPALASAISIASKEYEIPPLLMVAVAVHESRGEFKISNLRFDGGRDVGPFQIHCSPERLRACVRRFSQTLPAARRAAKILALGRALCRNGSRQWFCRAGSWWVRWGYPARYNPGSKKWLSSVLVIWCKVVESLRGRGSTSLHMRSRAPSRAQCRTFQRSTSVTSSQKAP